MSDSEKERPLSPAEARRTANLEELAATLGQDGWHMTELTASLRDANLFALVVGAVLCVPFVATFVALHGVRPPELGQIVAFVLAYIALIPIHEALHGLTWAALAPQHFRAIEFGFIREYLTPYCTSTAPMRRAGYLAGVFAPFLVLGVGLSVAGIVLANGVVLALGATMTFGAGGDLLVAAKLLKHGKTCAEQLCVDHPSQCGLVVFER